MFPNCVVPECDHSRPEKLALYCEEHQRHYIEHGSADRASFTEEELAPYRTVAEEWFLHHRHEETIAEALELLRGGRVPEYLLVSALAVLSLMLEDRSGDHHGDYIVMQVGLAIVRHLPGPFSHETIYNIGLKTVMACQDATVKHSKRIMDLKLSVYGPTPRLARHHPFARWAGSRGPGAAN